MKFDCKNQWKSWCTARNLCFNKKFQKKLYHFNRNSQLRSVMYKMIQLDIRSRTKNPTPTRGVVGNPTPPKNLRLRNPAAPCTARHGNSKQDCWLDATKQTGLLARPRCRLAFTLRVIRPYYKNYQNLLLSDGNQVLYWSVFCIFIFYSKNKFSRSFYTR